MIAHLIDAIDDFFQRRQRPAVMPTSGLACDIARAWGRELIGKHVNVKRDSASYPYTICVTSVNWRATHDSYGISLTGDVVRDGIVDVGATRLALPQDRVEIL